MSRERITSDGPNGRARRSPGTRPARYAPGRPASASSNQRPNGELGIFDIWGVVCRRWLLLGAGATIGTALAIAYFFVATPMYSSSAQLLIMRKDPKLAAQGVNSSAERDAEVSEDILATQMQIVRSKRIVGAALSNSGLEQLPSIVNRLGEDQTPTELVIDNLHVTRGGDGQASDAHVLNIEFSHTSPEDCQKVLAAILTEYKGYLDEKFQDVNEQAASLIEEAGTNLSDGISNLEQEFQAFREKNPFMFDGEETTSIHRQRYEEIQSDITSLDLSINELQSRLNVVEEAMQEFEVRGATDLERLALIDEKNAERVGVIISVQQGEAESALFLAQQPERMANAESEYRNLLTLMMQKRAMMVDFGPKHPMVQNLDQQIAEAQQFLKSKGNDLSFHSFGQQLDPEELLNGYVKLLRNDLNALARRRTELVAMAGQEEEGAKNKVKLELEGEALNEERVRQKALYEAVVERLRDINLAKDYGGFVNDVLSDVELGKEYWPNLPICVTLGAFFGLVLGSGGAMLAEYRDRSFHSADEIQRVLDLPMLAHIPNLLDSRDHRLADALANSPSQMHPSLWVHHLPRSREAEVFRGIRTSIFFRGVQEGVQVVASTSPKQGDGKSTLLANIAISMAQSGRRVLLVDCDLRRPNQHRMFGIENSQGLSDIVEGTVRWQDAVHETEVEHLSLVCSGPIPENPSELLTSSVFDRFLADVREQYDFVLLDCPPVLAVADPCIVGPRADAVMLVVRVSTNNRIEAKRAKEMLGDVGANVLGTLVNAWDHGRGFATKSYTNEYVYGQEYQYDVSSAESSGGRRTRRVPREVETSR
ncbi:MAG: polysaccharide biosynthesis tyrosine autokinase [Planctomycetales bacterium]|nr:polysaccharide biosynthesis tyrosine autokinase [Planctomycetales bacterium]